MVFFMATMATIPAAPDETSMNAIHKRRILTLSLFVLGLSLAAGFILYALRQNINVFLTPSQIATTHPATDYHFRLGGMVKPHSLLHQPHTLTVEFVVTDLKQDLRVRYTGALPDLFREGSGIIAEGSLNPQGTFIATQVLAKHDENYMPKKVYEAMKKNT